MAKWMLATLFMGTMMVAGSLVQPDYTSVSDSTSVHDCPGYVASNLEIDKDTQTVTADLTLGGSPCDVYGTDLKDLKLLVEVQANDRLHVKIYDAAEQVYQIPESVIPRPSSSGANASDLVFSMIHKPFSFAVYRSSNNEVLFNTSGWPIIFESQYLRLRTSLPDSPSLYGLGEHSDPFMLKTKDYVRTLWSADSPNTPTDSNLYGNHPVYFDHRGENGTHGVFLMNSNGMDVKINNTAQDGQYLEYNTLGGIIDLYFMAGPTPADVASQYADIVGKPAMQSYWSFGLHHCRYGFRDVYEVAAVVANHSVAGIPLETIWSDIDYMGARRVFSLDPLRYPKHLMRTMIDCLHERQQHYVMMVDPAVAYQDYPPFNNGVEQKAFLTRSNGSVYKGVVWPGVTAYPDWFSPGVQDYWNNEFYSFFNPDKGVDIDALWIDMNEAANFCPYPCDDPEEFAKSNDNPPRPPPARKSPPYAIPGFPPAFQPQCSDEVQFVEHDQSDTTADYGSYKQMHEEMMDDKGMAAVSRQIRSVDEQIIFPSPEMENIELGSKGHMKGLPNRNLVTPPYKIHKAGGSLPDLTIDTELITANGLTLYDTHNLYGSMMSGVSRLAMLHRKPTLRPLVITRSTFAGAGSKVGHWLGDNFSDWSHYLISISQVLQFTSLYQMPMVGADVCGFNGDTNVNLCSRWVALGAFSPFFRNHDSDNSIPQEFYLWPQVATAARNAIAIRYRLLDYIYTALYRQSETGVPLLSPMFFLYPNDTNTFPLQYQYMYGDAILVAPVTEEDSTVGSVYLPKDIWYDFYTHAAIKGNGSWVTIPDVLYTTIPLFYRGGNIVPLRNESANTTTRLRTKDFTVVIAPGLDGSAKGSLYLDDGESLVQNGTSEIKLTYIDGIFSTSGKFGYDVGDVGITDVILLGENADGTESKSVIGVGEKIPLTGAYSKTLI